jgi:hypothetical protein
MMWQPYFAGVAGIRSWMDPGCSIGRRLHLGFRLSLGMDALSVWRGISFRATDGCGRRAVSVADGQRSFRSRILQFALNRQHSRRAARPRLRSDVQCHPQWRRAAWSCATTAPDSEWPRRGQQHEQGCAPGADHGRCYRAPRAITNARHGGPKLRREPREHWRKPRQHGWESREHRWQP